MNCFASCLSWLFPCRKESQLDDDLLNGEEEEKVGHGSVEIGDKPLVALLADFDGCFDVMGDAVKFNRSKDSEKTDAIADHFLQYLKSLDEGGGVQCLSISGRQDQKTDDRNAEHNRNGKSFEEFPRLCREQGWTFDNHLLPDDNLFGWDGSSFNGWTSTGSWSDKVDAFLETMKFSIINSQLAHLATKHPGRPITVHVFDDKDDIVNALCADLEGWSLTRNFRAFLGTHCKMSSVDILENYIMTEMRENGETEGDCICCFESDDNKIARLQREGGGSLLQIPKDMTLHIHQVKWSKEYRDMGSENRSDVDDFVFEQGVFTSNEPEGCCMRFCG